MGGEGLIVLKVLILWFGVEIGTPRLSWDYDYYYIVFCVPVMRCALISGSFSERTLHLVLNFLPHIYNFFFFLAFISSLENRGTGGSVK